MAVMVTNFALVGQGPGGWEGLGPEIKEARLLETGALPDSKRLKTVLG